MVDSVTTVDGALQLVTEPSAVAAINLALVSSGISVFELHAERASLEEVFLHLTEAREGDR